MNVTQCAYNIYTTTTIILSKCQYNATDYSREMASNDYSTIQFESEPNRIEPWIVKAVIPYALHLGSFVCKNVLVNQSNLHRGYYYYVIIIQMQGQVILEIDVFLI